MQQSSARQRVIIIGSGFSGLCLGIQLKKAGIHCFSILEKADRLGGTWRENTYPGACCDVASFAYCFSFEQKTDWSRKWSPHDEILGYMEHCASKYGLGEHLKFNTEVARARFDSDESVWRITTTDGDELEADILVSGVGQLNRPSTPYIEGLESFSGELFHSARWDHDCELEGKNVVVIGNAASAIQFIPHIAKQVAKLTIFQRSANWMIERGDRAYTETETERFASFPLLAKLYRTLIWVAHELWWPLFRRNSFYKTQWEKAAGNYLRRVIADPALRAALTPDYRIGAKRILISDDYYPALTRDNVELSTSAVGHTTEDTVVAEDGTVYPADVIITATGFRSTEFLMPMEIEGPGGESLSDAWSEGAQAYYGMTVSGFPNFFMMYGPNTNLGHNSIIFMIECQANYIIQCLEKMTAGGLASIDLKPHIFASYNRKLQDDLGQTAWADIEKSWYKDAAGKITNNWSGTTTRYWFHTRKLELGQYNLAKRGATQTA